MFRLPSSPTLPRPSYQTMSPVASEPPETAHARLQASSPATTLLLLTCRAHISQINYDTHCFSSLNNVDLLLSIMLPDCCMHWRWGWGTMVSVWQLGPPSWACECILPSFSCGSLYLGKLCVSHVRQPQQVQPATDNVSAQLYPSIIDGWGCVL